MRTLAIDWSGAKSGSRSKIWLAETVDGTLVRLEDGRTREELVEHLLVEAERDPDFVVGFDFAFSLPEWFLLERGVTQIEDVWTLAVDEGEDWLAHCEPPFWGRPGKRKPDLVEHFRRTETAAGAVAGSSPKSVFQIGGAGAVGTGSIRGMPCLSALREAGFSVWPFHAAGAPTVVEIYPRLLTGPVVKSSHRARVDYLKLVFPDLSGSLAAAAIQNEDSFDAAVSALVMSRHLSELTELGQGEDQRTLLEGAIWWPDPPAVPASTNDPRLRGEGCPFCDIDPRRIVAASTHALAVHDGFPVSPGHTLVIPRDHHGSLFHMSAAARQDLWCLVHEVRCDLAGQVSPDGFNIGVNDGAAAGQTVPHAHVHIIPRFTGDVPDPRGGVRWVVPGQAPYWDR